MHTRRFGNGWEKPAELSELEFRLNATRIRVEELEATTALQGRHLEQQGSRIDQLEGLLRRLLEDDPPHAGQNAKLPGPNNKPTKSGSAAAEPIYTLLNEIEKPWFSEWQVDGGEGGHA